MPRASAASRRTQGILGGRSAQVVQRVLDAALEELASSGYVGFRMDEVAARAAVNKTSIYRRWPTRAALITALVERMRTPIRERPLPDTGRIESDLIAAFARRFEVSRSVEGRAWDRLLAERQSAEVEKIVGAVVDERREEWLSMVTRAVKRGELPPGTDARLVLDLVRAIVDSRRTRRLDPTWLALAARTVLAGGRAGTLVRRSASRQKSEARSTRTTSKRRDPRKPRRAVSRT